MPLPVPEHPDEPLSNAWRNRLARVESHAQRTYTPSLAVFARSEGVFHFTPEGKRLVDFSSGVLVMNLGHNPPGWWQRVWSYLGINPASVSSEFSHASNSRDTPSHAAVTLNAYNAATPLEILASERLIANLQSQQGGQRCEQILWAASGSEAIQKALWVALDRRPGADVILATRRGFHGKKGLAGAVTGTESDPDRDPRVRFLSFPLEECRDVSSRQQPLDLAPYEQELNRLAAEHTGRIAALITEPYLGGAGSYHPQPEYLQLLQRFCRRHDILFILDEIQSGLGRTGPMYAFTHYGLEPDLVVLGKALANGVPVAAVAGPAEHFARLHYGEGSDTWSANPLASAAVLATLDEYEQSDILQRGHRLAGVFHDGLTRLAELPVIAHVRGEGLVWGLECAAHGGRTAEEVANACVLACYRGIRPGQGIHLLGPLSGRVLRVSPPLVMTSEQAGEALGEMYEVLWAGLGAIA